jgi:hypothetical protein
MFQIQRNWVMDNYQARYVCKGDLLMRILYENASTYTENIIQQMSDVPPSN